MRKPEGKVLIIRRYGTAAVGILEIPAVIDIIVCRL
jgi:hypothetical protein